MVSESGHGCWAWSRALCDVAVKWVYQVYLIHLRLCLPSYVLALVSLPWGRSWFRKGREGMGLWEQLLITHEMFRCRVHPKFPVHAVYGCTNTVFHGIKPNRVPYRQLITRSQTVRVPLPSHGTVQPWMYGTVRSPIIQYLSKSHSVPFIQQWLKIYSNDLLNLWNHSLT